MKATLSTSNIKKLINSLKPITYKTNDRPALQYIKLDFNKDTKTLKATTCNGFILAIEETDIFEADESFIAYIKPILPNSKDLETTVSVKNGFCYIEIGDMSIKFKQEEYKWLNADEIVKKAKKDKVISKMYVNNELFASALKSVNALSKTEPCIIEFRGTNKELVLSTKSSTRIFSVLRSDE